MTRTTAGLTLALFVAACGSDTDVVGTEVADTVSEQVTVASAAPETTEEPTTQSTTTVTTAPPWDIERVPHGRWAEGGDITSSGTVGAFAASVVAGGPGFVAAGMTGDLDSRTAAVWTSADGRSWDPVVDEAGVFAVADGQIGDRIIIDLLSGPGGLVGVGAEGVTGRVDAAVWTSPDGGQWDRVRDDALEGPGDQIMWAAADFDGSVVAVGESGGFGAVWLSKDTVTWTKAVFDEPSALYDVAFSDPYLVAIGSVDVPHHPAVWLSTDGVTWSRLPGDTAGGGTGVEGANDVVGRMTRVVAFDGGLLAMASMAEFDWLTLADPAVWVSEDGFEWRALEVEFSYFGPGLEAAPHWVGVHNGDLVAVGQYDPTQPGGWAPATMVVWLSTDGGATWNVVAEADSGGWRESQLGAAATSAVSSGDMLVVVGGDAVETEFEMSGYVQWSDTVAVWIVTP
jgi:hypothetical protein